MVLSPIGVKINKCYLYSSFSLLFFFITSSSLSSSFLFCILSIMYNNSNNIHCNPTAWVIQQHLYVPQQQYNQHQQIILAHISESSSKLKHKEVVLYKTESCRNWNELGHCRYIFSFKYTCSFFFH